MLKWIGRLILLGILVSFCVGALAYCDFKASQPPDIKKAPYALQAYYYDKNGLKFPTRFYYAEEIEIKEGDAVLENYWTFDGERYNKHKGEKEIPPPYSIVRRLR